MYSVKTERMRARRLMQAMFCAVVWAGCSSPPDRALSVHDILTRRAVQSGKQYHASFLVRLREHGAYASDPGCVGSCRDIVAADIDSSVTNQFDGLQQAIDRTRANPNARVSIDGVVTVELAMAPSMTGPPHRRLAKLKVIRVLNFKPMG